MLYITIITKNTLLKVLSKKIGRTLKCVFGPGSVYSTFLEPWSLCIFDSAIRVILSITRLFYGEWFSNVIEGIYQKLNCWSNDVRV